MTELTNETIFNAARNLFPGGVNSPVRAFRHVGLTPRVMIRGQGSWLWDADGKRYTDFGMAWGSLILGHAPRSVVGAASRRLKNGSSFGAPTLEENKLGALVRDAMPSMERLRFVSSGTEAVMSAIRLARAATNRQVIVKFDGCYHGHSDQLLIRAGSGLADAALPDSAGVAPGQVSQVVSLPYNDLEAVRSLFANRGSEIAAVVVEPVAANMGLVEPLPGFLGLLRELTQAHGAILLFDEVITGFRLGLGGAQAYYGITPDLTTIGKIVGGGFPAAAYGGRADVMKLVAPEGPMYQAGTLSGNPVAMEAGYQTLRVLRLPGTYERLHEASDWFLGRLRSLVESQGYQLSALGSMFTVFFLGTKPTSYEELSKVNTAAFRAWYQTALQEGIYLAPSPFETSFLATSHTKPQLVKTLAGLAKAFARLKSEGVKA